MKILVLGGTGLISTAVTRQLLERGDDVTLFNRGERENNIGRDVPTIRGNRREYSDFEAKMAIAGRFDCVIDMIAFVPEDVESALRAFKGNAAHYIFCSTVDVYTKPAVRHPYTEDHPRDSISDYGVNKVRCEDIVLNTKGIDVTIIRPAMTYGEGGVLIHTFGWKTTYLDRLKRGKPVVTHGDGNSLWVACHIDDVGRAFVNAACNKRTYGKAYHVTGEEWLTWNRYHQTICEANGWPQPQLVHIPTDLLAKITPDGCAITRDNFQYTNIFDNSAAHTDMDFRYTVTFQEGSRRVVQWLEERGRIADSDTDPFDDQIINAWLRLCGNMADELSP